MSQLVFLFTLLVYEPVWLEARTPSISSVPLACVPADTYIKERVRTATIAERAFIFAESLLSDLDKEERISSSLGSENKELRETNQNLIVWLIAVATMGIAVGVGGVALW